VAKRLHKRERAEAVALHPHAGRAPKPGLQPRVLFEIAAGGALGALARHLLTKAISSSPGGFPLNTFTINMLGCLVMGILTTYLLSGRPHAFVRPLAVTGYLGGFTTFSHLIDDIYSVGSDDKVGLSIGYAAASVVGGWIAVAVGLVLGRLISHRGPSRHSAGKHRAGGTT